MSTFKSIHGDWLEFTISGSLEWDLDRDGLSLAGDSWREGTLLSSTTGDLERERSFEGERDFLPESLDEFLFFDRCFGEGEFELDLDDLEYDRLLELEGERCGFLSLDRDLE